MQGSGLQEPYNKQIQVVVVIVVVGVGEQILRVQTGSERLPFKLENLSRGSNGCFLSHACFDYIEPAVVSGICIINVMASKLTSLHSVTLPNSPPQ